MTVPDELLLAFFRETTSRLLDIDPGTAVATATENSENASCLDLADYRRCVLNQQITMLRDVTARFQKETQGNLSPEEVQERLSSLQNEPDLSPELKTAMEDMNDAARVSVCKLIVYNEKTLEAEGKSKPSRNLQDEGRLERTKLMEYFVLCQSALKLQCVVKFMSLTHRDLIFENDTADESNSDENDNGNSCENKVSSSATTPQSRLEYVQRLLAKGMGWNPAFVTSELRKIFVEKPEDVDYSYYDNEVMVMFQKLVEQMTIALRIATLQVRSKQDTELLNDLGKGGNTRVVSVQYSEFEVDQNGTKIESKNNAPELRIDERQQLTEEEKKRQLRLASEAAMLQQTILGELLSMEEDERNHTLNDAAEVSQKFMQEAMALPMGQERIDFLRSIDAATSRKLAMHKLWAGMLQANGGKPPKMVSRN